jgi:putative ABC transport system permease protein
MFDFLQSLKIALRGLLTNKGRAFLTSLGIMIGIASVVMVVSIGSGAQSLIINQVKSMGSNLVGVLPGAPVENGPPNALLGVVTTTLTVEDALALEDPINVPNVIAATPYVKGNGTVTYANNSYDTFYNGVSYNYINVEDVDVEFGRFFNLIEQNELDRVAVIGAQVRDELFNGSDPLGKDIKIQRETFRVIGVLEERGVAGFQNRDDQVFVPVTVAQKLLLGIDYVNIVRLKIDGEENIDRAKQDVAATIRERHRIKDPVNDDFMVESLDSAINTLGAVTDVLKFFLAAIAAISLVIGGIGIMNIMLISVTERIREIGLRKALGAKKRRILEQFLFEAIVITMIGGVAGIVVGASISVLVALVVQSQGYQWDLVVSGQAILVAFLVSTGVGITFGYYPAKKAADLNPIDALRHE